MKIFCHFFDLFSILFDLFKMQKESRAFQPVIREIEIEIDLFILICFSLCDVYDSILNYILKRKKNLISFNDAHVMHIFKSYDIFIW